ncbi:hypothetical protein GS455_12540 [Rhodococcus hoagii]|nr:hypothetical protein [Prescottella equi]
MSLKGVGVGAAVLVVGVDAVEEDVPHAGVAVEAGERGVQGGLRLAVNRLEEALLRDERQVLVTEFDVAEPAGLVGEGLFDGLLGGAGVETGGDPPGQVVLGGRWNEVIGTASTRGWSRRAW